MNQPPPIERGVLLTIGSTRCIVVEVFNTDPAHAACDVLTHPASPTIRTAIHDHDGWRFLDAGRRPETSGALADLIRRLAAG